jgi:signal transduction histidine kinase
MTGNGAQTEIRSTVVIWTPVGKDAVLTREALRQAGIESRSCNDSGDVSAAIRDEHTGLAILAEEALSSKAIEEIKRALEQQPPWSDLPLLLLTGGGNSTGASLMKFREMRVLGNMTLLERPLRRVTLIVAVQAALASRRRQLQTKAYIEELQEAQNGLAQANADLQQFAFAASHDLQEPLRTVNSFTQLLLQRHISDSNEQARQYADYIRTGVKRMEALLRDLLLYSRAIHEKRSWPTECFELNLAVNDAMNTLHLEIDTSGAQVNLTPLPVVRGDRTQLSLVFQNLLSNSIKYARHGIPPTIDISASESGSEALVRVQDDGLGFDQKYSERIFDLFQRLSGHNIPGTGLGLAICRRIVERHGGRIWAESAEGQGATFLFTLPIGKETDRAET